MYLKTKLKITSMISGVLLAGLLGFMIFSTVVEKKELQVSEEIEFLDTAAVELHMLAMEYLLYPSPRIFRQWQKYYNDFNRTLEILRRGKHIDELILTRIAHDVNIIRILYMELKETEDEAGADVTSLKRAKIQLLATQLQLKTRFLTEQTMELEYLDIEEHSEFIDKQKIMIMVFCACIIIIFMIALHINNRNITIPIHELQRAVNCFEEGNFSHKVYVDDDDLKEIAGALNQMAGKLHSNQLMMDQVIGERVRQLNCLYSLTRLVQDESLSIIQVFEKVPELVVDAMKHPELACARLVWYDKIFKTENYVTPKEKIVSRISVEERNIGFIEAGYPDVPEEDDQVFSREDEELIRTFCDQLGEAIEHHNAVLGLQKSEAKYRMLLETMPQRVFYKDSRGRYIAVNSAFSRDLGKLPEEIIGMTDYQLLIPETAAEYASEDQKVTELGRTVEFEDRHFCGGKNLSTQTVKTPVVDDEGNITGLLGIYWDISQRKDAEDKLLDTLKQLEASNEELKQFAYVASHDLQEPLRMISSYIKMIEKRYNKTLDDDALSYITMVTEGAERMKRLIDALLSYSRIGNGNAELSEQNMNEILLESLQALALKIEELDAQVIREKLPVVWCDPIQISQLLQNLVCNALKFRKKEVAPVIRVSCDEEDNEWVFCIEDNGIGINPDYFKKIFVIFQRLHSQDEYNGTGIGLAVCKKIVERHKGRIWVESAMEEGTRFFFTIPKHDK